MKTPMQRLIDCEMLVVTPADGAFDVDRIAARIEQTGFAFRDETEPSRFVVSSDKASRDVFQQRRRDDPENGFPRTLMIDVTPEQVLVWPVAGFLPLRALSEDFLEWLTNAQACHVTNDDGGELPARVAADAAEAPP